MKLPLPTSKPFSLARSIAFLRSFPPCRGDYVLADDAVTAAVSIGGVAHLFTVAEQGRSATASSVPTSGRATTVEVPDGAPAQALVARAAHFLGSEDDVTPFYRAAEGDPPFRAVVERLHGLHHVRFLTLEEIAVYCVMMQRTPITVAARLKRRFLERFGRRVGRLIAFPEMAELVALDADAIADAIQHRPKANAIVGVVRGVAAIGEAFLRTAPYAEARDALLAIPGVGPFSAAAILLRGLGRMDELPAMHWFEDDARRIYGRRFDARAVIARYGADIGYWSFYVKTGAGRPVGERVTASSAPLP